MSDSFYSFPIVKSPHLNQSMNNNHNFLCMTNWEPVWDIPKDKHSGCSWNKHPFMSCALNTLYSLFCWLFMATLSVCTMNYPHFTGEETKALDVKWLVQGPTTCGCQNQDSSPGLWDLGLHPWLHPEALHNYKMGAPLSSGSPNNPEAGWVLRSPT